MKTFFFVSLILMNVFLLNGCANSGPYSNQTAAHLIHRESLVTTTNENYPAKNPTHVSLYKNEQKPKNPYRIIGIAKVSKFNLMGMKRQETLVNEMMKNLAASIGGDALININNNKDNMQANIIAFEKILI